MIETKNAAGQTYGSAFSISYGPGAFSGTAQSGYASSVKIVFETPSPGKYWYWCGDQYYPQDSRKVRAGR